MQQVHFMVREIIPARAISGEVDAPPSKAHTLRAIIIGALAQGSTIIKRGLIAEDQVYAIKAMQQFGAKIQVDKKRISDRFSRMAEHFEPQSVDGVVLDIGVSSMQLDEAERGFSFMRDGPLDMRMSDTGPTAADLVNELDHTELARILYVYGEEHASRRIASFIIRRREERKFERTLDLAHVIERALGGRKGAKVHPATRSFQGLRIAVNEELAELEAGLAAAEQILKPGGRLAVVTFHSLEDRIVKNFLAERAGRTPGGSRHLPQAPAGAPSSFQLIANKAIAPGEAELAVNPRARSSKLRAAIRTTAPIWEAAS